MSVRRSAGISASAVLIILIQTSAMGNVAFESSDVDLDGWQSPPHDVDTILQMFDTSPKDFQRIQPNNFVLDIRSPPGALNCAFIQSRQLSPFDGNEEYFVELYVMPYDDIPIHWFYIYDSRRITIVIDKVEQDGKPHVRYYTSTPPNVREIGPIFFNQWNSVEIHVNPGGSVDFEVSLNHGDWISCLFNDRNSNGDIILLGDDEFNQESQNFGHCYFDNIRIYHLPQPSPLINNYDLSEEFGMGKDYKNGQEDAKSFWTAYYTSEGYVWTVRGSLNIDKWRDRKHTIYINCPRNKKAWAETPHFYYNKYSQEPYWISMWIYIESTNCNFFHVIYNGHVNIVTRRITNIDWKVTLNYVLSTADHPICELATPGWYRINIKVTPLTLNPYYEVFVNGEKIIPPGQAHPRINLFQSSILLDENDNTFLQMGIDTANNENYGEMFWDQVRFDRYL